MFLLPVDVKSISFYKMVYPFEQFKIKLTKKTKHQFLALLKLIFIIFLIKMTYTKFLKFFLRRLLSLNVKFGYIT